MKKPYIILASQSPRRKMLLTEEGYDFEIIASLADEKAAAFDDVHEVVIENAKIKGDEVVRRLQKEERSLPKGSVLLAADTLVVMGQKVYGKPRDMNEALTFLQELGGVEHQVLTGVFLYDLDSGREHGFLERTRVMIRKMADAEIQDLFRRVTPLDKAAGYGFQDDKTIVTKMIGPESNVIGLPVEKLAEELVTFLARS